MMNRRPSNSRPGNRGPERPRQNSGGHRAAAPERSRLPQSDWEPAADAARKQKNRSRAGGGREQPFSGPLFNAKSGDNTIRILPPTWRDPEHYCLEVWEHRYVGPDEGNFLCLKKMRKQDCPICDAESQARKQGDTEYAKKLRVRKRWVCYVLDRDPDDKSLRNKPLIFDMDVYRDEEIVGRTDDRRNGGTLPVTNRESGYDLYFRKTGKGSPESTRYGNWEFDRDPSPISDDPKTMSRILAHIYENPIDKVLKYHDVQYLEDMMFGTADMADPELMEASTDDSYTDDQEGDDQGYDDQSGVEQDDDDQEQDDAGNPNVSADDQSDDQDNDDQGDDQDNDDQEQGDDDGTAYGEPDVSEQPRRGREKPERRVLRSAPKPKRDERQAPRQQQPRRPPPSRQRPQGGGRQFRD